MGFENRRHNRIDVALEVRVRGMDRYGLPFQETTSSANVSRSGCSFQTSQELELGTELEVEIYRRVPGPRGTAPFFTKGVVMRAIPEAPDQYLIGIQFTGPQFSTFSSESTTSE